MIERVDGGCLENFVRDSPLLGWVVIGGGGGCGTNYGGSITGLESRHINMVRISSRQSVGSYAICGIGGGSNASIVGIVADSVCWRMRNNFLG